MFAEDAEGMRCVPGKGVWGPSSLGEHLVLELPGWVQPAPVIVAIQAGLFD
jgi:hypothetical protein